MNSAVKVRNDDVGNSLEQSLFRLCNDTDFKKLEADLKVFNPFRVLKVERYELRHTTTLAWLLDPLESHGMGDIFLRSFLAQVAPEHDRDKRWAKADTASAEVLAERVFGKRSGSETPLVEADAATPSTERLDVLIEGRSIGTDGTKWCVAIEAKIDSKEGANQLERYDKWLTKNFSGHNLLKLYLTVQPVLSVDSKDTDPDGVDPDAPLAPPQQGAPWVNILWGEHVANALDASMIEVTNSKPALKRRVLEFIRDYRELLAGLSNGKATDLDHRVHAFANQEKTSAVLRTLKKCIDDNKVGCRWDTRSGVPTYWRHRALLEMCALHVRTAEAEFMWEQVLKVIAHNDTWRVLTPITAKTLRVIFVPKSWLNAKALRNDDNSWKMYYQADFRPDKADVELKLYVPKTANRKAQKALLGQFFHKEDELRPVASCFAPNRTKMLNFIGGKGASLKLHAVSAKWTRRKDGSFKSVPDQDQKKESKYCSFWTDVEAHTNAILTLA